MSAPTTKVVGALNVSAGHLAWVRTRDSPRVLLTCPTLCRAPDFGPAISLRRREEISSCPVPVHGAAASWRSNPTRCSEAGEQP